MDDHGTYLKRGDCASTESEFKATFQEFNLELPVIHKGWIDDIFPAELPEKISFAHLDIDLYEPTLKALTCIYPRLADRAIVVIDDYYHSAIHSNMCRIAGANNSRLAIGELCPGVKGACDDFFADKPEIIEVMFSGDKTHCFFRKLGK
jgi:O-methyltransferase